MGTRKIVKLGDDTLRKVSRPQEKFDRRLESLLKDISKAVVVLKCSAITPTITTVRH